MSEKRSTIVTTRTALIIGASRGLGLGLTERFLERGWLVPSPSRHTPSQDLGELAERWPGQLSTETVDIDDEVQVDGLHERLTGTSFELVFGNAGTPHDRGETVADVSTATFERVMRTNALSPMRVVERFQDLVPV